MFWVGSADDDDHYRDFARYLHFFLLTVFWEELTVLEKFVQAINSFSV